MQPAKLREGVWVCVEDVPTIVVDLPGGGFVEKTIGDWRNGDMAVEFLKSVLDQLTFTDTYASRDRWEERIAEMEEWEESPRTYPQLAYGTY